MLALPFQQKLEVEQRLGGVELENLVLAFRGGDGATHLVYNLEQPPPAGEKRKTHRLGSFQMPASDPFDILTISFSAIDVLFPSLPTHGANFYSIEHVFRQKRQYEALRRTSYNLARTVLTHMCRLSKSERQRQQLWHRACVKILQMATPEILHRDGRPAEGLIAVVIPDEQQDNPITCLNNYLERQEGSYEFVYNSPPRAGEASRLWTPSAPRAGNQWVISLEEVGLLSDALGRPKSKYVDLRAILRNSGAQEALRKTCRDLARTFWAKWKDTGGTHFRDTAYSLAAEVWLADEDVEDLVALFPHQRFERFLTEGEALRVYRVSKTGLREGGEVSDRDALKFSVDDVLPPLPPDKGSPPDRKKKREPEEEEEERRRREFEKKRREFNLSVIISFRQLADLAGLVRPLGGRDASVKVDLGLVLWKAGKMADLGRTFWLLSRELLHPPISAWRPESKRQQLKPALGAITEMAVRAVLTYSMHDPWRWRQGRYEQFVKSAYRHLDDCLHHQQQHPETPPLTYYYYALRQWYGCLDSDNYKSNLEEMIGACDQLERSAEQGLGVVPDTVLKRAKHLHDVGAYLMNHLRPPVAESAPWFDNTEFLRTVADSASDLAEPTPAFEHAIETYKKLRHRLWQHLDEAHRHRPSPRAVEEMLDDLQSWRAVLYGPAHETFLLNRAGQEAISLIAPLKHAMETGAAVTVVMENSWLPSGKEEVIMLDVQNIGEEGVTDIELVVERFSGLDATPYPPPLKLDALAPGEVVRHRLNVTAVDTARVGQLTLRYGYSDARGQRHVEAQELSVAVRRWQAAGRIRFNPFEAGRPVYGENHFFGRNAELARLLSRLPKVQGTNPIVLRGPRRIGKSSLLREFELVLRSPEEREARGIQLEIGDFHPVFTNLQSVDPNVPDAIPKFLRGILTDVADAFGMRPSGKHALLAGFDAQTKSVGTVKAFIAQVEGVLRDNPGHRLVILLDELDVLFRPEFHDMSSNLRNIIESKKEISWFTSSTMLASVIGHGSPWYNLLQVIELRELEWAAASELIQNQSLQAGIQWDAGSIIYVLEQTGQRPYLIQLICSEVVDYINSRGIDHVTHTVVRSVTSQWLADSATTNHHFGFIWSEASWMGKLILWMLNQKIPVLDVPSEEPHQPVTRDELFEQTVKRPLQLIKADPERSARIDPKALNEEFREQMKWLDEIADVITNRKDRPVEFNVPLVHRWLASLMAQENDFMPRAISGLIGDLMRRGGADG